MDAKGSPVLSNYSPTAAGPRQLFGMCAESEVSSDSQKKQTDLNHLPN